MKILRNRFRYLACALGMLALAGCGPKPEPVDQATMKANARPATGPRAGVPASAPDPVVPGRPGGAPVAPGR
ncbi:MAG: hypothetical protein QM758_08500 [Armatimonas sp.]